MIFKDDALVGVLSFNTIETDEQSRLHRLLVDEAHQAGHSLSVTAGVMRYYAERGEIRRFVIKCRVANQHSNSVAVRNGFTLEGVPAGSGIPEWPPDDVNIYGRIYTL